MTRVIKADGSGADQAGRASVLHLVDLATEARQVVLEARKEAARIVAEAKHSAGAARKQAAEEARAEGFDRGRSDGYTDGLQKAQAEVGEKFAAESAELLALARSVVEALLAGRAEQRENIHQQVLAFAVELAEKIVGHVAATDISAAEANLAKALELAGGGRLVVKVNPNQLERLRKRCGKITETLGLSGDIRLIGDERIGPGGVKVLGARGEIDATIRTQLANVVEALFGSGDDARGRYQSQAPKAPFVVHHPAAKA
ncbi:MAG: hypothetical protein KAU28_10770 [Phycisphaerae bacterium]|nr:hypothetical protein [Phycisphaerae bacterium]